MPDSAIILQAQDVRCAPAAPGLSIDCETRKLTLFWGDEDSGKNHLLRLLGLLEIPADGEVFFHGAPTSQLPEVLRTDLRNVQFGYLFAEPFLLPSLSVVENVAMPLLKISSPSQDQARIRTQELMAFVGMDCDCSAGADQLSLVEQHKVALARALINQPEVLIVENIDHNLHGEDLARFGALLQRASTEFGPATIVTAASESISSMADRSLHLVGGIICGDSRASIKGGATV